MINLTFRRRSSTINSKVENSDLLPMGSLFHCLPDEIGWECLVRVELNSHHNLRCVCKSWNAALKNPHFYQERKRLKRGGLSPEPQKTQGKKARTTEEG